MIHRGLQVSHFAKLRFSSLLFLFSSNISININISKPNYNYHASYQTLAQLFPLSLVRGVSVSIVIPMAELNDPFLKREHFKPILVITRQSLAFVTVNKSFRFEVWETRKIFFFFLRRNIGFYIVRNLVFCACVIILTSGSLIELRFWCGVDSRSPFILWDFRFLTLGEMQISLLR